MHFHRPMAFGFNRNLPVSYLFPNVLYCSPRVQVKQPAQPDRERLMGSLGELSGGLSTYHLPEEPRLLHTWRLAVRLTLFAVASFFLLMFLSQQARASDGSPDAASSQASASADASSSDSNSESGQARADHRLNGPKGRFQAEGAEKTGDATGTGESNSVGT